MPPPEASKPAGHRYSAALLIIFFAVVLAATVWGYLGQDGARRNVGPIAGTSTSVAALTPAPTTPAPAQDASAAIAAPAPAGPEPSVAMPVSSKGMTVADGTRDVRGVVKARDEVLFSSKIAALIAQMPYKEGERFKKGSVLVSFDCMRVRAEANAAWAANRASRQVLTQSEELDRYAAIGKSEVQIARAKADQTAAEATALEAQMRDCTIVAPFSGIVVETMAHAHENVAPGKELTKVLNDSDLEVHLIVPSAWFGWLQPGSTFRFRVDETGRTHEGRVVRLGAAVDPVSQTARVVGTFAGERNALLPGMSGSADFDQPSAQGKSHGR